MQLTRLRVPLVLALCLAVAGCAERVLGPVRSALSQADSLAVRAAAQLAAQHSVAYRLEVSGAAASFSCPAYSAVVRFGHPFGVTSLRLPGQPVDFSHPNLPLADWEWFWFDEDGRRNSTKLIDPDWGPPALAEGPDQAILRFSRRNVLEPGIDLAVEYRLGAQGAAFEVEYTVDNHSGKRLAGPYAMVGFPGFSNHVWISEVATAVQSRVPRPPYATFLAEALADGKSDSLLLRHDVDPRANPQALAGKIVAVARGGRYALEATCVPGPGVQQVYSAHTIKRLYLTSHLYVFLSDMEDGETRQVLVHYALAQL